MDANRVVDFVAAQIRKSDSLTRLVRRLARQASPEHVLVVDYPVDAKPRWDKDRPHGEIYEILDRNRSAYVSHLESFLPFLDCFRKIPVEPASDAESAVPNWKNGWLHALDTAALYGFIAVNKPKHYMEVGSGNSTRFARRAITDHNLDTKIISIDPEPRREIDRICDEVVRSPAEGVDLEVFDRLGAGDILFIDSSHRVFMNSDVTTLFIDVIPRLHSGVLVEIHDVMLPFDYPEKWGERHYSEQYLLAAYLLAEGSRFEVVLPNSFISSDEQLRGILAPLWESDVMDGVKTSGSSFWMRIR
jgi:hypothetical protein